MESELANRIRTEIQKIEPEAEVYLFGSRARGDFSKDSDWDVLVISPLKKITIDYEFRLQSPISDIELETGEVISLLIYSKKDWLTKQETSPLFRNVAVEGVKL